MSGPAFDRKEPSKLECIAKCGQLPNMWRSLIGSRSLTSCVLQCSLVLFTHFGKGLMWLIGAEVCCCPFVR